MGTCDPIDLLRDALFCHGSKSVPHRRDAAASSHSGGSFLLVFGTFEEIPFAYRDHYQFLFRLDLIASGHRIDAAPAATGRDLSDNDRIYVSPTSIDRVWRFRAALHIQENPTKSQTKATKLTPARHGEPLLE